MDPRVLCLEDPQGPVRLALVAKRAYRIQGTRLLPLADVPPLQLEPEHVPSANPDAEDRLWLDTDVFAPLKPSTDVLVRGPTFSTRGPVRMLDTQVQVGPLHKNVRVWGRRTIQVDAFGRLAFSQPEPFTSAPLLWDDAYGGRDKAAEDRRPTVPTWKREEVPRGTMVYPPNPSGRGFFLDFGRERLEGTEAPRLEDPADPVTADRLLARDELDWMDRPAAACYEPVDLWSFPRVAFWLGVEHHAPAEALHERRRRAQVDTVATRTIGAPPDPRVFNCAPVGLSGVRLEGREKMRLAHLHPSRELLEVDLPGDAPQLLVEPPGCGVFELPPLLATVLIEPAAERVTLTWTGTLEVAAPYSSEACGSMRRAVRWRG